VKCADCDTELSDGRYASGTWTHDDAACKAALKAQRDEARALTAGWTQEIRDEFYAQVKRERETTNARAHRFQAALESISQREAYSPGEESMQATARAALAQSADAPETSAKTSEVNQAASTATGRAEKAPSLPAEAPKSRDSHPLFKYDTNDECSACAECKACGCADCDVARDAGECAYECGRRDERAQVEGRPVVR
jgi:hypothetical protein